MILHLSFDLICVFSCANAFSTRHVDIQILSHNITYSLCLLLHEWLEVRTVRICEGPRCDVQTIIHRLRVFIHPKRVVR